MSAAPLPPLAEMERHARLLGVGAGEVHELRLLAPDGVRTGLFSDPEKLAKAAAGFDGSANIYIGLNPVSGTPSNSLARAAKRDGAEVAAGYAYTPRDEDVAEQRRLFLDIDPVRAEGFVDYCSTEQEHAAALSLRDLIENYITAETGAAPLAIDTGNGGALVYALAPPMQQLHAKRVLEALAEKFDTATAHVDKAVHNPSRIHRLAGTLNCKKAAPDRPQRRCHLEREGAVALDLSRLEAALGIGVGSGQQDQAPPPPTTDLTPEEIGKIVAVWTPGNRHAIAGPLAGALRKAGWPQAAVEALVRQMCAAAGDAEVEDRLRFVRDTYSKHEAEVAGWPVLEEAFGLHAEDFPSLQGGEGSEGSEGEPADMKAQLVALAEELVELSHDGADAYAKITYPDHRELVRLRSRDFKNYMAGQFYERTGRVPGSEALGAALNVIEAKARQGPPQPVYVRVAPGPSGEVYIDLCDAKCRVVEVTASGWRVLDSSPVRFRRGRGMLPLPEPQPGRLVELREHVNVATDGDWALLAAVLVQAEMPTGPYPVLGLHGEHGSAKSTTAKMARAIIDPNKAMARAEPKSPRDLMIAASNSWVQSLDNLSRAVDWISNAICRLATGGGFAARELYSDGEEAIFDAQRPVILNGISAVAVRQDLLDRSVLVTLPMIPDEKRRTEGEVWSAFDAARPRIFGGLLSAVACALRERSKVKLPSKPRMADFAVTGVAAEPEFGVKPGTFLTAYQGNRATVNAVAVEGEPVAAAVLDLLKEADSWKGSMTDLLGVLAEQVNKQTRRSAAWPESAAGLRGALERCAPNLRQLGVVVDFGPREGGTGRSTVAVYRVKVAGQTSQPSQPSADPHPGREGGEDREGCPPTSNTAPDPSVVQRRVLDLLLHEVPRTLDELERRSGLPRVSVKFGLYKLRNAGLAECDEDGLWHGLREQNGERATAAAEEASP